MSETAFPKPAGLEVLRIEPPARTLAWAERSFGAGWRVSSIAPLRGGISHANHLLVLENASGRRRHAVLRRWARPNWREDDPEFTPEHDVTVLSLLATSDVPAPRLIAADPVAAETDVPAILMSKLPGRPLLRPRDTRLFLSELARTLLAIHAIDAGAAAVPRYVPYYERERLSVPAWSDRPTIWEQAIEIGTAAAPSGRATFIHRDYHPGNVLWVRGTVSGVVDWSSAMAGSPSVDVAQMRANLAVLLGIEAADTFSEEWRSQAGPGAAHDPYWDLRVAVDFLPELPADRPARPALLRLERFVESALRRIEPVPRAGRDGSADGTRPTSRRT